MSNGQSQYGYALLNTIEEIDRDSADVRFVFSFPVSLKKDGDQWCCLLGENLQEGHGVFHKVPWFAVSQMNDYLRFPTKVVENGN